MNSTMILSRDMAVSKRAAAVIGVIFFVLATAFGAYIRIPVPGTPVPITLQTFFVVLSGALLGRKLGSISQISYLLLGAMGLPVFQGYGAGMLHLFGPTGGYLMGFVAASFIVGRMLDVKDPGMYRIAISFISGSVVIYGLGVSWLMVLYRVSFTNAVALGLIPFLTAEAAKMSAAAIVYRAIADRSKSIFS